MGNAIGFLHGQQADFKDFGVRRQVIVQIGQFAIQRKGTLIARTEHAHQLITLPAGEIGVLGMEFIDQPPLWVGCVLGNFFHKGLVVEPVNLLKFPIMLGNAKIQAEISCHSL